MIKTNAQAYREGSDYQYALGVEAIEEIPLKGNEKVLDIACGDGRVTARLKKKLPRGEVIGVDVSEDMVALAQKTYPSIPFLQQDATCLSIEGIYDCITAQLIAHFFHDKKSLLEGWRPFLKSGGYLLLTAVPDESPYQQFLYRFFNDSKWISYFNKTSWAFTSTTNYLQAAKEAGYELMSIQLKSRFFKSESVEYYKKSMRGVLPMLASFPSHLVETFLEELVEALKPYRIQGTEQLQIPLKTLMILLKR